MSHVRVHRLIHRLIRRLTGASTLPWREADQAGQRPVGAPAQGLFTTRSWTRAPRTGEGFAYAYIGRVRRHRP